MFRWIIGSSLKFRFLVIAAAAAMIVLGLNQVGRMPVDVFPEFAPPLVEIQTEGIGMSTREVEELVTVPMEEALRGTPEVDVIRSKTVQGLSSIVTIFKRGTDIMRARQLVEERFQQAQSRLPVGVGPAVMLQPLSSTSRVMKIGLTSKTLSMLDLSMTTYWKIRWRLLRVPGVANVPIWGERLKQLQVQIDPERMRARGVTIQEVVDGTSEALDFGLRQTSTSAKTQAVGFVEGPNQRLYITPVTPSIEPETLGQVPIESESGEIVRLGEVSRIVWEEPLLIGDGVINDVPGLMLIVEKLPWANTLDVTRGVEAALAEMKGGVGDIEIDHAIFRPATFIETSIHNLTVALVIGALLVVLVLIAFLYEWRVALISLLAIPLSLMAALLVLYLRGGTINTMVLAGFVVALGSIVDDAIIDVENIVRRLRQHRREGSGRSTASVILEASLEIRTPIVYATLIIVLAVTPVLFLGGLAGAFFEPLAIAYSLSLLASMVVALTVTPALCLLLLDKALIERESPLVGWLQRHYDAVLLRIIDRPRSTVAAAGVVLVAGLACWPLLGQSLLPSFKERDFLMHWLTPPGTSHPEVQRVTVLASKELRAIPGVRNFGAHIGRALVADEVVGIDFTENWISIDPKVDYDKTLAAVTEAVDGYPGIYRDVQTYLRERIKEVLTGSSESIVVRIFGPDLDVLRRQAVTVRDALAGIPGMINLHDERQKNIPQIEVTVDLAKAGRHGLKPGDVRRAAAVIFAGEEVSDIHRHNKVYDVMVWSIPEARHSLHSVRELLLDTADGGPVRLGEVADVRITGPGRPSRPMEADAGRGNRSRPGERARKRKLGASRHAPRRLQGRQPASGAPSGRLLSSSDPTEVPMKRAIALTLLLTALGAPPALGAEIEAEDLGRAQLAAAAAAKVTLKDAIAAAEKLSNGGQAVEATYYLQTTPPSASYEVRAFGKDGMWEARLTAETGEMRGAAKTTPRAMFDEDDRAELTLVQRSSTTITKAVEVAEQHAQGKAIAADLEKAPGGGTAWHVVVVAGETARKVIVDPMTGRVRSDARLR